MAQKTILKLLGCAWIVSIAILASGLLASAQEQNDAPLGDVARNFRKKAAPQQNVIDNDNFDKVLDEAESHRLAGSAPVFSLDPGGNSFRVSTPDVSCSLSFRANATSLLADPVAPEQLPPAELAKLDGPASIDGDSLQVSLHNGTQWELREVIIGLTVLKRPDPAEAALVRPVRLYPAFGGYTDDRTEESFQKRPDETVLLRIKGSAAPSATAIFRTALNAAPTPDQDWHWAILRAKGIPPQDPPAASSNSISSVTEPSASSPETSVPLSLPSALASPTHAAPAH